jgi:hypothetical protein
MHVCSTLWTGSLADDLEMDATTRAEHERRRALHFHGLALLGLISALVCAFFLHIPTARALPAAPSRVAEPAGN